MAQSANADPNREGVTPVTAQPPDKHAFLSYVHEDCDHIEKLGRVLGAANIPFWRDRLALGPGDMWKSKIREAIRSDALAFLACFSTTSIAKPKSYQNEELSLAVEEFRMRAPGYTWLIPVRFDDCVIPDWDLGAGRQLADVNYIDLFGDGYAENAVKLIETVKQVMGLDTVDAATVRTAVDEADAGDRPALLRRLTKDMILDESRRIDLDDLITQEVSRILNTMRDAELFPDNQIGVGSDNEAVVNIAETAAKYWQLVEPFCWSLQVAARWGAADTLGPWIRGLNALATEARKVKGGLMALADLRDIPVLASVWVAALASTAQGRWENFNALLVENTIPDPSLHGKPRVAIIASVTPYHPFGNAESVANVLAHSVKTGDDYAKSVAGLGTEYGRYYTPVAEWLFAVMRPVFREQFVDDDAYESAFDYAEVALGVVTEDLAIVRATGSGRPYRFYNKWFGRATWRYARDRCDPVADLSAEHAALGTSWAALQAGLFGGSGERAAAAIEQFGETFREVAGRRW